MIPATTSTRTRARSATPMRSRSRRLTNSTAPSPLNPASDGDAVVTGSEPYNVRAATSRSAYASTGGDRRRRVSAGTHRYNSTTGLGYARSVPTEGASGSSASLAASAGAGWLCRPVPVGDEACEVDPARGSPSAAACSVGAGCASTGRAGMGSQERPPLGRATPKRTSSPCSLSGSTAPSRARRSNDASTPANAGATRAISSWTSSTVSRSKSVPRRAASSAAMRQLSSVVPSGVIFLLRRSTRPSRFVVLPACSPHTVVDRNTSARTAASPANAPTTTSRSTRSIAAWASARSGKSASTSQPTMTRHRMAPLAAAWRIPVASRPRPRGT